MGGVPLYQCRALRSLPTSGLLTPLPQAGGGPADGPEEESEQAEREKRLKAIEARLAA